MNLIKILGHGLGLCVAIMQQGFTQAERHAGNGSVAGLDTAKAF
ncbi:MAG: hypothetical protein ACXV7F_09420 [Methylomonas sp.]